MPHHSEDRRYPHLKVERVSEPLERRRAGGRAPAPNRGGREVFGPRLERAVTAIQTQVPRASRAGAAFNPHLVFKIPYVEGTPLAELSALLSEAGIVVVSMEPSRAIIGFKDDGDLSRFMQTVRAYQTLQPDARTGRLRTTTDQDVLEYIEADEMAALQPEDRVGPSLASVVGEDLTGIADAEMYTLDVELWATGEAATTRASLAELTALISQQNSGGERVLDTFPGKTLCLARVRVTGRTLRVLLGEAIVAEVNLPPRPSLVAMTASTASVPDLPSASAPPEGGPRLCILDSGVASAHPLLAPHIGHEESILTAAPSPADANGHGTRVAGVAVYGDIADCIEQRRFDSPITLYSARLLNNEAKFDDERLLVNQILAAVELFSAPPYSCHVFNLSVGAPGPSPAYAMLRQSQWAEVLDRVAAHKNILFVVAAGNYTEPFVVGVRETEDAVRRYPSALSLTEARLNDPATASLALTVGSLAHSTAVGDTGEVSEDLAFAIAGKDEPSPFTRTGPGFGGSIKPELVDYGGNLIVGRFGGGHGVDGDPGTSIISLNKDWLSAPFAYDVGTSMASPRVARLAALLWDQLQQQLDEPVQANLVRAVLASAASTPPEAVTRLGAESPNDEVVLRCCGYGRVDEQLAMQSGDRKVTLISQGEIDLDTFVVYGVPIPPEFVEAPGAKTITVSLAYDPPVRRRRVPYEGVQMQFDMLRGVDINKVFEAYKRAGPDEELESIQDARRIAFEPSISVRRRGTLQRGRFHFKWTKHNSEEYWLVVRAIRKWAPEEHTKQTFAVAVTLEADDPRLYGLVRTRLVERVRARVEL